MFNWSRIVVVAALAAGCTGQITGSQGGSPGSGGGSGSPTGTGSTGVVSTGTGSTGIVGGTGTGGTTGAGGSTGGTTGDNTPDVCTPGTPATSQIARLTNAEYDSTIRDLLGVTQPDRLRATSTPSTILATDQAGGADRPRLEHLPVGRRHDRHAGHGRRDPQGELHEVHAHRRPARPRACTTRSSVRAPRLPAAADDRRGRRASTRSSATARRSPPTGAPTEIAETLLYMFLISPSFLQRAEIAETADGSGQLHALELGGGVAPLVHALGLDAGRHAEHGRRQQPADDARADPGAGPADAEEPTGPTTWSPTSTAPTC